MQRRSSVKRKQKSKNGQPSKQAQQSQAEQLQGQHLQGLQLQNQHLQNQQPQVQLPSPQGHLSVDRVSPQPQLMTRMLSPQPHSSFFQYTEVYDHDDYQDDSLIQNDVVRKISEIYTSNDKAVQVPQDLLNQGYNLKLIGPCFSREELSSFSQMCVKSCLFDFSLFHKMN